MITLNGSTLEGGGQLVRVALSLSAIRSIPLRIERVRANRAARGSKSTSSSGGLKESHLAALQWLADACGAKTSGDEIGSREFTFRPQPRTGQLMGPAKSSIELKKSGSVWLVLQAVLPFVVFSIGSPHFALTIKGGTNVSKSMSGEYVQQVLVPTLEKLGLPKIEVDVVKRGWANAASEIGEVCIRISRNGEITPSTNKTDPSPAEGPSQPQPFILPAFQLINRGTITSLNLTILAPDASTRTLLFTTISQALQATDPTLQLSTLTPKLTISEPSGDPRRLYVLLVAHTSNGWRLGRDVLLERKAKTVKEREKLVEKAAEDVVRQIVEEVRRGGCVDEYMQDQLVVWQALAEGESIVQGCGEGNEGQERGSLHTQTVRWVCEQMLGDEVVFGAGGRCRGVGQSAVRKDEGWENEKTVEGLVDGIHDLALNHA